MRAKAIPATWHPTAIAFALGLGIIALGAALAHAETPAKAIQATAATAGATQQTAASGFVCRAKAGGWCDLRDWSGFAQLAAEPGADQATGGNFQ